jgi:hypothetical protein
VKMLRLRYRLVAGPVLAGVGCVLIAWTLKESLVWPALFSIPAIAATLRAPFLGVAVANSETVIRGWWRTYRIPHDRSPSFEAIPYSGFLNRYSESRRYRMLQVTLPDGSASEFESVAGRRATISAMAETLNTAVRSHLEGTPDLWG